MAQAEPRDLEVERDAMERPAPPIFIIGVPRSGTTLLRVMLDSHPWVAGLPETPWLTGGYGPKLSFRALLDHLTNHSNGLVANVSQMQAEDVRLAGRQFLETMLSPYLERIGKRMVVFKTPDDVKHLSFLTELYPDSKFLHIYRDGRDSALSALKKRSWFSGGRQLNFLDLLGRWHDWEHEIRRELRRVDHLTVRYETLAEAPEAEVRRICTFLGLPFERCMIDYGEVSHDYPDWEAGSDDVRRRKAIDTSSIGRWKGLKPSGEMLVAYERYGGFLKELGYEAPPQAAGTGDQFRVTLFLMRRGLRNLISPLFEAFRWRYLALKRHFA